jgi:hypothetical protein
MRLGAQFAGIGSPATFISKWAGRRPHLGAIERGIESLDLVGNEALELIGRVVNRLRERRGFVLRNDRRAARDPGLQAADFVSITRLCAAKVAQMHLNAKNTITVARQRSLDDTFNASDQLIVAADVVIAIDQNLHRSISSSALHEQSRK